MTSDRVSARRLWVPVAVIGFFYVVWPHIGSYLPRYGSRSITTDNLQHLRVVQLQAVSVAKSCNEEGAAIDQSDWPVFVECLNRLQPAQAGPRRGAVRPLLYFLELRVATGTVRIFLETPWPDHSKVVAAVAGPLGPLDY